MTTTNEAIPMTALGAVNLMLDSISQDRIHSLMGGDLTPDAEGALGILTDTSRELQRSGWHFNQDFGIKLEPDQDGHITLPTNVLKFKVRPRGRTHHRILTTRGRKLYDAYNHTFKIGETVEGDVTVALPYDDLPMSAKWLVAVRAARRFATTKLASMEAFRFTSVDEEEAWVEFLKEDAEIDNTTMAEVNPHIRKMRRR